MDVDVLLCLSAWSYGRARGNTTDSFRGFLRRVGSPLSLFNAAEVRAAARRLCRAGLHRGETAEAVVRAIIAKGHG